MKEGVFIKLWVDDIRTAPDGYVWAKSVNEAIKIITEAEKNGDSVSLVDTDHDAGDFAFDGGDYIKLLDWLEETNRSYLVRIHSMNPVGVSNMRAIIRKNGWKEIF